MGLGISSRRASPREKATILASMVCRIEAFQLNQAYLCTYLLMHRERERERERGREGGREGGTDADGGGGGGRDRDREG